jgi:hypothetical protein|tara:strand:+ start:169559 stop:170185 length:627 start_codon:yes stop_codon:yes gene_type:complete
MIYKIILSILAVFCIATSAQAQAIAYNYESFALHADKMVRGKVVASQSLNFYRDGKDQPCGVYMEIEVIESYRGGDDNFLLYSTNSDVYLGDDGDNKDREYLIFAFKNPKYDPTERFEEYVLCEGKNSATKNIAPFEYINDSHIQRMFPIKKGPRDIKEWMLVMERPTNAELAENIEKNSVNSENRNIIEEVALHQFLETYLASASGN